MTRKQFAEHQGISEVQVSKDNKAGYLEGCWRRKGKKYYIVSGIADKHYAERKNPGLRKGVRISGTPSDAPPSTDDKMGGDLQSGDYLSARTWETRFKAAIRKLDYEIKTGKYILRQKVKDQAFMAGRIFRDAILNIGPRIAPILAAESDERKIQDVLTKEFNAALNELAKQLKETYKK